MSPWGLHGLGINRMVGAPMGLAAPMTLAAAPLPAITRSAPMYSHSYMEGPAVTYKTGVRTMQMMEPVEQHGYEIRY